MQQRDLEPFLRKWLYRQKVLVITGARQVGKTTLVERFTAPGKDRTLLLNADEPHVRKALKDAGTDKLRRIVGLNKMVIIDEVQRLENPGLLLKLLADTFKDCQVIATGSSSLDIADQVFEPLTGRHLLFHLYPFTLHELYSAKSELQIREQLSFHLVYGSYPDVCNSRDEAELLVGNLASQYLYKDVLAWKDIRKPDLLDKLLQLLAHQICSEISLHEIGRQLNIKTETVDTYISLLEKSFVVFRLKSYSTNQRKEVSKMKKIYFWDNGIRNAILGDYRAPELRTDTGALWENLMVTERLKRNHYLQRAVTPWFWRSLQQQEVDYVELEKKKLSAFEMKFSPGRKGSYVTKAFTNLYPKATTNVITPENFMEFCQLET